MGNNELRLPFEEKLGLLSALPILEQVRAMKAEVDQHRDPETRKLRDQELEQRILQKIRLNWNFHSNAIEGNSLTYGETVTFLMQGLTAKGKPLKDHLDIKGHNEAIFYLENLVKDERGIVENDIRELHKFLLKEPYETDAIDTLGRKTKKTIRLGEYKREPNHVKTQTGEIHYYASPEATPRLVQELVDWYREQEQKKLDPILLAAIFHHQFVAIHPFDDGNGRMTRLLMNLILMRAGFPPVVIEGSDHTKRAPYYAALNRADSHEYEDFVELIAERMRASLELYLRGLRGESLEDPDDLEKEMLLFKMSLDNAKALEKVFTPELAVDILEKNFRSFLVYFDGKMKKMQELFFFDKLNEAIFLEIEKMTKKDLLDKLPYTFYLKDFKQEDAPFSMYIKLQIVFDIAKWSVSYCIGRFSSQSTPFNMNYAAIDNLLFSKKYNEEFSSDSFEYYAQIIQKEAFAFMKETHQKLTAKQNLEQDNNTHDSAS